MKLLTRCEEIILLSILKLKHNAYGVSIRQLIYEDTGDRWSFASIYQPLDKLVRREYARKIRGEPTAERGGKSKFYYRVTPKGKQALLATRRAHDKVWTGVPIVVLENGKSR
jgi:PadR family transcriptional regulator PadR